jgi:hypothetical protein
MGGNMAEYKVVQLKEKKALAQELEETLNEHAKKGWTFVEMERAHRATSLFFLLVFTKD